MTKIIIAFVELTILLLWAIIGPIFWLPFLVRMIALFIATVLVSAGGESNMGVAQAGLDRAARFYSQGFVHIRSSMSSIYIGNVDRKASWTPATDFWQPLATHVVAAAIFWGITVFSVVSIIKA